ncbi:hypothetical protein BDBG_16468 [Blastomyces gilchristii SLH14081]|uniref:Uncharacterized protein n=1 Tax=Blastomyces gilchristii (strain SLH14081) TaxID=559298 RepID=A0A179UDW3_BLAGS|nr:uncharacterized protein BDBG_16468 [Blastomyces gilchristii SLH14081]OAT05347.1 hypothetical protein BDBG_16468 [Blastomyces gilchristii SLH14081]
MVQHDPRRQPCGGAPYPFDDTRIFPGDVIISDAVVEYDFGRRYSVSIGNLKSKEFEPSSSQVLRRDEHALNFKSRCPRIFVLFSY